MSETLGPNLTISHYRILSKIGAGGMGEVYLAQDTKLDRNGTLNFLEIDLNLRPYPKRSALRRPVTAHGTQAVNRSERGIM